MACWRVQSTSCVRCLPVLLVVFRSSYAEVTLKKIQACVSQSFNHIVFITSKGDCICDLFPYITIGVDLQGCRLCSMWWNVWCMLAVVIYSTACLFFLQKTSSSSCRHIVQSKKSGLIAHLLPELLPRISSSLLGG